MDGVKVAFGSRTMTVGTVMACEGLKVKKYVNARICTLHAMLVCVCSVKRICSRLTLVAYHLVGMGGDLFIIRLG